MTVTAHPLTAGAPEKGMKLVFETIDVLQARWGEHPYFHALLNDSTAAEAFRAAKLLAFWVMAFQDTLKLNAALVEEPAFRQIAEHHLLEDAGHDTWFLCDMIRLKQGLPDLQNLFSDEHKRTREATYRILGEIFRAESDLERLTLILTLEAAGHRFFEAVSRFQTADSTLAGMEYLSESHLNQEKDHEMFEAETQRLLLNLDVPNDVCSRCVNVVTRVFDAFAIMMEGLYRACAVPLTVLPGVALPAVARAYSATH